VADRGRALRGCPVCGDVVDVLDRFCSTCGNPLREETLRGIPARRDPSRPNVGSWTSLRSRVRVGPFAWPLFVAFMVTLLLTVLASVLGAWLIALLLAPIALTLGFVWADTAWDNLQKPLRRAARRTSNSLWASTRITRVSLASWSNTGRVELRTRAQERQLRRQRDDLLHSLGEAAYREDEGRAEMLKRSLVENDDQLAQNEHALELARAQAAERVEIERSVTAPTQVLSKNEVDDEIVVPDRDRIDCR
jgi:hypothetical protein